MSHSIVLALMAIGLMSACVTVPGAPDYQPAMHKTYSNSVGFTGVGREPF